MRTPLNKHLSETPVYNQGRLVGTIMTTTDTIEDIISRRKRAQRDARLVQMWTR